ncbi:MAG: hypothetical protein RLZZ598_1593, partial [Pseudomonadota bacterium]
MKILDSSNDDLDAFDTTCQRLGGFSPRVATEWADGYLTALAAGPRVVSLEEWLPRMAGDAFERAFADPEDAQQARQALLNRTRVLASHLDPESLLDEPEAMRLGPLVSVWDDAARQAQVDEQGLPPEDVAVLITGGLWAEGFFDAIEDFAGDWQVPDFATDDAREVYDEILLHVSVLMLADDDEAFQAHLARFWKDRPSTREDLLDEACFAIQDLRVWWLD